MHMKWFGDVYTYAHRAMIHGVADPEKWLVHPMLFSKMGGGVAGGGLRTEDYVRFLGLEAAYVLSDYTRTRGQLLADVAAHPERHLFLDPDTGIGLYWDTENECLKQPNSQRHITGGELVAIARGRRGKAVLVFDHSYLRTPGTAREKVTDKLTRLRFLAEHGLTGAAVIVRENPCVCYVLVAVDGGDLVRTKIDQLRARLHIPESHFVMLP